MYSAFLLCLHSPEYNVPMCFTNVSQVLREPIHGRCTKNICWKMSDYNMKCMETPQGSPNTGTGDRRRGFQDEMVVRLGSFCLAGPTPRSCCDLVLLLNVSLWPSERCWVQPVIILSWMVVAPLSHFLGFQGMQWWCSDTGFSIDVSEEWLIWLQSSVLYWGERISLSFVQRDNLPLQRGGNVFFKAI